MGRGIRVSCAAFISGGGILTEKRRERRPFFKSAGGVAALCAVLFAAMLLAVRAGGTFIGAREFFGGLFSLDGYETQTVIIYYVRLPRVIGAVLAGMGLAVSGALLQSVTGNELAGPNIIGVNAGAGFAVIMLLWAAPQYAVMSPAAAFAGAFLATLLIVSAASRINGTSSDVILAGIAVTAVLNAAISFISLLDTDALAAYSYFSVGGLSGVTAEELPLPAVLILGSISVSVLLGRKIDALCLGDGAAASLGIRVKQLRLVLLVIASAAAAAAVSFAGLLGFVGLVSPHIARRLCGGTAGFLLPVSALTGAILTVAADLAGRTMFAPTEIPVGIIMAFIGAPFFFWLLIKKKRI